MDRDPKSVSATVPDEARLAELVQDIRDGVAGAALDLQNIFYPGVCFLLRRRLGDDGIEQHAQSVIAAVVQKIRTDNSVNGRNLPKIVRQVLIAGIPNSTPLAVSTSGVDGASVSTAKAILSTMSPVERDALRSYVSGDAPDSFLSTLRLTVKQFNAIRLRARAEFSTKTNNQKIA